VTIRSVTLDRLANLAQSALPFESCALLMGEDLHANRNILEMFVLTNHDRSAISFSVDPDDLFCAYEHARKIGLDIVGIFHSHPSMPRPSRKDIKFMRLNPIVWLIYSTLSHTFSAFMYSGRVIQVRMVLIRDEGVRHPWGITQPL
jgi:proteasome lid subunit RPN8/RPN11